MWIDAQFQTYGLLQNDEIAMVLHFVVSEK
jgi:hypothetical protein